jgi:uncharacterized repeat protein (TIGR03803 family)
MNRSDCLSRWTVSFTFVVAVTTLSPARVVAQVHKTSYDVIANLMDPPTSGWYPHGGLMQANDGNFYGRTAIGGEFGGGTVFRMTPDATVTVLHNFTPGAECHDGPLIQASDGALYGTVARGGEFTFGEVYRLTLDGDYSTLHSFKDGDAPNGSVPCDGVVQGLDGALYGVTMGGGEFFGRGTAYRIALDGSFSTIHSFGFDYPLGGYIPQTRLVVGKDGALYGKDSGGGLFAQGMAFRLAAEGPNGTWVRTTFHDYVRTEVCFQPAGFIRGTDGSFYGVGGTEEFYTEVYRLTSAGDHQSLHVFDVPDDLNGYKACGGVIQGRDGGLYGTTAYGGEFGRGIIYRVGLDGSFTKLHDFAADESRMMTPLKQGLDGAFYGITGGAEGSPSVVFRLRVDVSAPIVRMTANGSDGPITLAAGEPLTIDASFDAPGAGLATSNVFMGLSTPLGLLWLSPTGFKLVPSLLYSGPFPDFASATLFNFPSTAAFPLGSYQWFMIVHDPGTSAIALDVVQTIIVSPAASRR